MLIRKPEDLTDLEELALIDMSYSRLNTYQMCEAKYFYTYILQEPRIFGAPAALGNVLHSVLEEHVGDPLELEPMFDTMNKYREVYDPDHEIPDKLLQDGQVMLTEFVDRHVDDTFQILAKELPFHIIIGPARVVGFMDLVLQSGNTVTIIDYKSGKREVAQKNAHKDLQLGLYGLALSKMYPGNNIKAELYYLRSGRRKYHYFTQEDLESVKQRLESYFLEIINKNSFHYTSNEIICSFCEHAQSGVCPVGKKRLYKFEQKKKGK